MGVLDRFRAKTKTDPTVAPPQPATRPAWDGDALLTLAGTTTTCAPAVAALVARGRLPERGHLETTATLQREPGNPVDPYAVAVLVDGERIAYLPGWAAKQVDLPAGAAATATVQLFTALQDGAVRVKGSVWLGAGHPQWVYDAAHPAPVTREEERAADHARRQTMVAEATAGGGARAAQFKAGMVNGVHYLELVEPIRQLKREGRLEEALVLCYAAITGAENDAAAQMWDTPAPFYTDQAAIVLRKLKRPEEEAAVLRRYLAHIPAKQRAGSSWAIRLAKLAATA